MITFCINPISANEQCFNAQGIWHVVKNLVDCFEYLLPAISKRRARLIYDVGLEQRQLRTGQHFMASINSLPRADDDPDVKVLWLTYTKNRAEEALGEAALHVTITSPEVEDARMVGYINEWLIQDDARWLSFGGQILSESPELQVRNGENKTFQVRNAHHLDSLTILLPRYEASPKHRQEPYVGAGGERVSPMQLGKEEAQRLLLASLEDADDRWAYQETRKKCYRFRLTHNDQQIYHGYEVEEDEVPRHILNQLLQME